MHVMHTGEILPQYIDVFLFPTYRLRYRISRSPGMSQMCPFAMIHTLHTRGLMTGIDNHMGHPMIGGERIRLHEGATSESGHDRGMGG